MLAQAAVALIIKVFTVDVIAQILVKLAKYLAAKTTSPVDDEIVAIIEKKLEG